MQTPKFQIRNGSASADHWSNIYMEPIIANAGNGAKTAAYCSIPTMWSSVPESTLKQRGFLR